MSHSTVLTRVLGRIWAILGVITFFYIYIIYIYIYFFFVGEMVVVQLVRMLTTSAALIREDYILLVATSGEDSRKAHTWTGSKMSIIYHSVEFCQITFPFSKFFFFRGGSKNCQKPHGCC